MANDGYLRAIPSDGDSDDGRLYDPTVADSTTFTVAVSAAQAGATASAVAVERFVAAVTVSQSAATVAAIMVERFVADTMASQSGASVVAIAAERFSMGVTASQSGATAAAIAAERFSAAVGATQPGHAVTAAMAERFAFAVAVAQDEHIAALAEERFNVAIAALQDGHTAAVAVANQGVGGIRSEAPVASNNNTWIVGSVTSMPRRSRTWRQGAQVAVAAAQSAHTCTGRLQQAVAAAVVARQQAHRVSAMADTMGIADDEERLLVFLTLKRAA